MSQRRSSLDDMCDASLARQRASAAISSADPSRNAWIVRCIDLTFRFNEKSDSASSDFRCIEQELHENRILVDTNIPASVNLLKITLSIEPNQGKAGS